MTFEEFFRGHYAEVVRSMRLMVGDRARAEELTQEAFTSACRQLAARAASRSSGGVGCATGTVKATLHQAPTEPSRSSFEQGS
jgi:hypothetical protein